MAHDPSDITETLAPFFDGSNVPKTVADKISQNVIDYRLNKVDNDLLSLFLDRIFTDAGVEDVDGAVVAILRFCDIELPERLAETYKLERRIETLEEKLDRLKDFLLLKFDWEDEVYEIFED